MGGAVLRREQPAVKELNSEPCFEAVRVPCPQPRTPHVAQSREARSSLPPAAFCSFASSSSAPAAGGDSAEATAGEAAVLTGCSVVLHLQIRGQHHQPKMLLLPRGQLPTEKLF